MNGLKLIQYLQLMQPSLPIIIVSAHERTVYAAPLLFPNVKGYIAKQEAVQRLVPTIRRVLAS
jgi:DNA-binding NarL/FixJ family response regulator